MRRSFALLALLSLAVVTRCGAQAPAAQDTPEALAAAYNQAVQARDWTGAVADAKKLVDLSATAQNLRLLADAQLSSGATEESLGTYVLAATAAQQEKPAQSQPDADWKEDLAKIYIGKGNALLKLNRTAEAVEEYNHAAEYAANPGLAYFNICAVLYNSGDTTNTPAACRKCLQADPSKVDAWFILGSVLFVNSPMDTQGKVIASSETREALEKYLALAPDGPHAADVKAMLAMIAK
jgi:tetratricopeptide (TPR) repeat protein